MSELDLDSIQAKKQEINEQLKEIAEKDKELGIIPK
jgi:hypothetical protein